MITLAFESHPLLVLRLFPTASQARQTILRAMFIYNGQFSIKQRAVTGCASPADSGRLGVPAQARCPGRRAPDALRRRRLAAVTKQSVGSESRPCLSRRWCWGTRAAPSPRLPARTLPAPASPSRGQLAAGDSGSPEQQSAASGFFRYPSFSPAVCFL